MYLWQSDRKETLLLSISCVLCVLSVHPPPWPLQSEDGCQFPDWVRAGGDKGGVRISSFEMLGDWEVMTVQADLLSYFHHNDPATMSTLYAKCVRRAGDTLHILTRNHWSAIPLEADLRVQFSAFGES